MSSPIIDVSNPVFSGIGTAKCYYVDSVASLSDIALLDTVGLALQTLILTEISSNLSGWTLKTGTADVLDPTNQVAPHDYNAVTNNVHWLRDAGFGEQLMAATRVTTAGNVNIASGVPTAVPFTTSRFNTGEWNSAVNPTRLTAQTDGIFAIAGSASFASNVTGQRTLAIRRNGSVTIASEQDTANSSLVPTNITASTVAILSAGDYIELIATQTSGGNLDVLKADEYSPELSIAKLGAFFPVILTPSTPSINTGTSTTDTQVGNVEIPLSITSAGWYRIWQGSYPASGNFNIRRTIQADGQTSDTSVDFTIIAGSPEGIINITRNSVPSTGSPSIDGVRVLHDTSTLLAYVEVHLLRGGSWVLRHSASDTSYLDAPFLVADTTTATAVLAYALKPNVTGGTGAIDVPKLQSGGNTLLQPPVNTWALPTGTVARTTFDTASATLTQVAQRLAALEIDAISAGWLVVGIPTSMLYTDMLALSASLIAENQVANVTDIFRVSVAPDTTVQAIYIPVGTFNGHNFYKIQGWEYEVAGQNSPRQCYWSSAWATWTISNLSGNLYHSGAAEASPWLVAQWKDQASANVAVTTVTPNIPLTYNALTDTHTAMILTGSTSGYNGLYLRGGDLNAKRRYYLVGTGSNNKRIEWTGTAWNIKDDSATYATSSDAVTYPDQVTTWSVSDVIAVTSVNAVDLMSGLTIGGNATYNGIYIPVQGVYNSYAGRSLTYRRTDGTMYLGNANDSRWNLSATIGGLALVNSDLGGQVAFPWNTAWTSAGLTVQQNKIASPGWNNLSVQPNTNITNNVVGNFHL
jgi:hypothetical protein